MALMNLFGSTVVKNLPASSGDVRDVGLIPGSGRSPGVGNGNPLQYSCLGNQDKFFDFPEKSREVWLAIVHGGHKESDMPEQAHMQTAVKTVRDCDFLSKNIS